MLSSDSGCKYFSLMERDASKLASASESRPACRCSSPSLKMPVDIRSASAAAATDELLRDGGFGGGAGGVADDIDSCGVSAQESAINTAVTPTRTQRKQANKSLSLARPPSVGRSVRGL